MDAIAVSKSEVNSFMTGDRMMAIKIRPVTIFVYFWKLEFGSSISRTVARRIKMIIFVTHSLIKSIFSPPYLTIIVKLPAAIMTVIVRKNIKDTIPSAAKT